MTVYLGADHAGTNLKEAIKRSLLRDGVTVEDLSPSTPEGGDDYPDYAVAVAERVAKEKGAFGVLVCDTGIGMAIAANKVHGAVAALVTNSFGARRAREHNDANILVFGSECITPENAVEATTIFLTTEFSGAERHIRRVGKVRYLDTHGVAPPPGRDHP